MSKYLYATNTLTNNEIDMPALQTSMGIQRQVGILHQLPEMPLQREGGEIEMPRKDLESRAKYARQYYLLHQNEKHEYDKAYRQENIEAKAFKDKIYRILHADEIRILELVDMEKEGYREQQNKIHRNWRRKNNIRANASSRKWYQKNKSYYHDYRWANIDKYRQAHNDWNRRKTRERRKLIVSMLGGICVSCGIVDWRVLELDHINHDGKAIRRMHGSTLNMYKFYLDHPNVLKDECQLLCANCHRIKHWENGWK